MESKGINRLLYDRRLELGYSVKEACIRLDISKLKLSMIENGYTKVKDKKLQEKFIFKYKLDKDFFNKDSLEYPSSLDDNDEEDITESKIVKLFKNLAFKIATLVLSLGFVSLLFTSLYRYGNVVEADFFSEKYNNAYNYAAENGTDYLAIDSKTASMLLCNYKAIESEDTTDSDFIYESLNFFTNYDEYVGYAFFDCCAVVDVNEIIGLNVSDAGYARIYYESRMNDTSERIHFYAYAGLKQVAHFSVDYDYLTLKFNYNLVETLDYTGALVKNDGNNFYASIYKAVFESKFNDFEESKETFLQNNKSILGFESLEEFNTDQAVGLVKMNNFMNTNTTLVIISVVLATVCFALFTLAIIITTTFGKKVLKVVSVETEENRITIKKERTFKPLPKNRLPAPIIPEAVIRIVAFILMVIGSMSLYYIFNSIMDGDIIGTFESLQFRAAVASFTTLGMILIFFIKLDIIQNKKNAFLLNYILFFAGFIFYILTLLISRLVVSSPALERFKILLDLLPGNIVWGILAFNLLTTNLLSKPKFKTNIKRNTILYRLSAIIPLGYMIASSVIQIGKKAWGWNLSFAVSSLFFTKAIIITAFTILYCLVIFIYRRIVDGKFGRENAEIYVQGNRYQYIKNILVCLVFAILGVADLLLGKNPTYAQLGFGANYGILCLIPLILLYHPHRGARNKKWDLVFNIAYGFSLLIGIVAILSSVSVYITSL